MASPKQIIAEAQKAAEEAMKAKIGNCTPMMVIEPSNVFDNSGSLATAKAAWHVPAGVCGFAWVEIHPARGPVVKEMKKQKIGRPGYPKGWHVSVHCRERGYEQSLETMEAGANAYAKVLQKYGVNAYSNSRLD